MIRFIPLGGAGEIGAQSFYLNISNTGILLDCGMHPRKKGFDALPDLARLRQEPLDFCFISHAHHDHIGSVPVLVKEYPHTRLFTTRQTIETVRLTLHDTVSILRRESSEENLRRIYGHEEIDFLVDSMTALTYDTPLELQGMRHSGEEPIKVTFKNAGHVLGSAGILLEWRKKSIFYTGDIALAHQTLIPGAELPHHPVETLIMEITYGATPLELTPPKSAEIRRLSSAMNRVLEMGGSVLIPVFAFGKTQEMAALIWNEMEKGRLAHVPLYVGGLGKRLCSLYDTNRYIVPRMDKEFEFRSLPLRDINDVVHKESLLEEPCIVLATSGMMTERTLSYELAKLWLKNPRAAIFFCGYTDPSSPGYAIANAVTGASMYLNETEGISPVRCLIGKFRFTSHATREDLRKIVRTLKPIQTVLVHGEAEAADWVGHHLLDEFPDLKVFAAENGKELSL